MAFKMKGPMFYKSALKHIDKNKVNPEGEQHAEDGKVYKDGTKGTVNYVNHVNFHDSKGPTMPSKKPKSALKHGTHKDPEKTQMSDFPKDREWHKHGISDKDGLVYIPVKPGHNEGSKKAKPKK